MSSNGTGSGHDRTTKLPPRLTQVKTAAVSLCMHQSTWDCDLVAFLYLSAFFFSFLLSVYHHHNSNSSSSSTVAELSLFLSLNMAKHKLAHSLTNEH